MYFLDSSALVKRYVMETGTAWVQALGAAGTGDFCYLARITDVEVTAALARRRGRPGFTLAQAIAARDQFRLDFAQDFRVIEMTAGLLSRASQLADVHGLRGYDAVQLAAALDVQDLAPELVLVSADGELNAAAQAEGLAVEDPNSHP